MLITTTKEQHQNVTKISLFMFGGCLTMHYEKTKECRMLECDDFTLNQFNKICLLARLDTILKFHRDKLLFPFCLQNLDSLSLKISKKEHFDFLFNGFIN